MVLFSSTYTYVYGFMYNVSISQSCYYSLLQLKEKYDIAYTIIYASVYTLVLLYNITSISNKSSYFVRYQKMEH